MNTIPVLSQKIIWAHVDCNPLPTQIQQDTIIQAEISGKKEIPLKCSLRAEDCKHFPLGGGGANLFTKDLQCMNSNCCWNHRNTGCLLRCFTPHEHSDCSLFLRHGLVPVPRKTFFTSMTACIGIHTSLQAPLLVWKGRKLYSAALL